MMQQSYFENRAKVNGLVALVDELETHLATAYKAGSGLMEAVVAELTARA
jgi:hypothetical protein